MSEKLTLSLAQLHAIYSVYRDIDADHNVHCCTCGRTIYIDDFTDCYNSYGHYIPRSVEPKLKYHPNNVHPQCVNCNLQVSSSIDKAYDEYMKYRYGNDIRKKLLESEEKDTEELKQFYILEIAKLSTKYPELSEIVIDTDTGELLENNITLKENPIEEQWDTYSQTYKQDLDELTKALGMEAIEYERF